MIDSLHQRPARAGLAVTMGRSVEARSLLGTSIPTVEAIRPLKVPSDQANVDVEIIRTTVDEGSR